MAGFKLFIIKEKGNFVVEPDEIADGHPDSMANILTQVSWRNPYVR